MTAHKHTLTEVTGRHGLTRIYHHSGQIRVGDIKNEELYRREVESRLIAEVAKKAHVDGYKFVDWPTLEWRPVKYVDGESVQCPMSEARNVILVLVAETELQ